MTQTYTTAMSNCPFGIEHYGSAEATKENNCIRCTHPVCDGRYWFTETKKADSPTQKYFQENIDEILKALHVNRNKGGEKNKETWIILQDKDPAHNKGQKSVFGVGKDDKFKPNREKATWGLLEIEVPEDMKDKVGV